MEKVRFDIAGGQPLNGKDIKQNSDFLETTIREYYNSVSRNMIISGCIVTNNNISAGWIMLDGELCYVPAHTRVTNFYKKYEYTTGATMFNGDIKDKRYKRIALADNNAATLSIYDRRFLDYLNPRIDYWPIYFTMGDNDSEKYAPGTRHTITTFTIPSTWIEKDYKFKARIQINNALGTWNQSLTNTNVYYSNAGWKINFYKNNVLIYSKFFVNLWTTLGANSSSIFTGQSPAPIDCIIPDGYLGGYQGTIFFTDSYKRGDQLKIELDGFQSYFYMGWPQYTGDVRYFVDFNGMLL